MGEGRTGEPRDVPPPNHRLTVEEAAARLGITEGAVRSRIKRGTLPTVKDAGRVFVVWGGGTSSAYHATDTDEPTGEPRDQSELVAVLREQLAAEREAHAETRRIAAMLAARIPAIEAPQEPREGPQSSAEASGGVEDRGERTEPQTGVQEARRPWWRRWFGG